MAAGKPIKISIIADANTANRAINGVTKSLTGMGKAARTLGTIGKFLIFAQLARYGVQAAKAIYDTYTTIQRATVAFKAITGSAKQAAQVLKVVKDLASTTHYPVDDLAQYAKQLLAAGTAAKDIKFRLTTLLDTASAFGITQEQTGRAVLAFTQIQQKSTVQAEELNQLAEAGIPIYKELSKATGLSASELKKLGAQGKLLSADVIPKLYEQLHKDFGGQLEQQAATLQGRLQTLSALIKFALSEAFGPFFEYLRTKLPGAIDFASTTFPKLLSPLKQLPGLFEAVTTKIRAFATEFNDRVTNLTGQSTLENIADGIKLVKDALGDGIEFATSDQGVLLLEVAAGFYAAEKAAKLYTGALALATTAQTTLNTAMSRAPYVLIAVGIANLVIEFTNLKSQGQSTTDALIGAFNKAAVFFAAFGTYFLASIEYIGLALGNSTAALFMTAMDKVFVEPLRQAALGIANLLDKLPDAIKPDGLIDGLREFGNQAGYSLGDELSKGFDEASEAFKERIAGIPKYVDGKIVTPEQYAKMQAHGKALAASFGKGIGVSKASVEEIAAGLPAAARKGANVPGALAAPGTEAGKSFANGVRRERSDASRAGTMLTQSAARSAGTGKEQYKSAGGGGGKMFGSGVLSARPNATSAGRSLSTAGATGASSGAGRSAFERAGSFLGQGLASGLSAARGAVQSAASALVGIAEAAARKAGKIFSPSRVFIEIGRYIVEGFVIGLVGGVDDVRNAMTTIMQQLVSKRGDYLDTKGELTKTAAEQVKDIKKAHTKVIDAQTKYGDALEKARERVKRAKATKSKTDDKSAADALKHAGDNEKRALRDALKAYQDAVGDYRKTKGELKQLDKDFAPVIGKNYKRLQQDMLNYTVLLDQVAKDRESLAAQLEDANDRLSDAISIRDDYIKGLTESTKQFAALSALDFGTDKKGNKKPATSDAIVQQFQDRLTAIQAFTAKTQALAKQGLSNGVLKQILDLGVEQGGQFAEAILAGGASGITSINSLNKQIESASSQLGTFGGTQLYQAGVTSAQKLVDGLESAKENLDALAVGLATQFAELLKKTLGQQLTDLPSLVEKYYRDLDLIKAGILPGTASGTLGIPRGEVPATTGNQYSISVQTGVGDPVKIGREVLDAIQAYEKLNGKVVSNA